MTQMSMENFQTIIKTLKNNKIKIENINLLYTNIEDRKIFNEAFRNKVDARFLQRKQDLDIVIYSLIRVKDFFKAIVKFEVFQ